MVVRQNKKILEPSIFISKKRGYETPKQDVLIEFIRTHPNCTRADMYQLDIADGDIRKLVNTLTLQRRIRATFSIIE